MESVEQGSEKHVADATNFAGRLQIPSDLELIDRVLLTASSDLDLKTSTKLVLDMFCEYSKWPVGHAYEVSPEPDVELVSVGVWHLEYPEKFDPFRLVTESAHFQPGDSLPGPVLRTGKPFWTTKLGEDSRMFRRRIAGMVGLESGFAFPAKIDCEILMVFELFSTSTLPPAPKLLELFPRLANIFALAIDRKRLLNSQARLEGRYNNSDLKD